MDRPHLTNIRIFVLPGNKQGILKDVVDFLFIRHNGEELHR